MLWQRKKTELEVEVQKMQNVLHKILVHYGEIGLKGKNQPQFRRKLRQNLVRKLAAMGLDWPVWEQRGYLWIHVPEDQLGELDRALQAVREVFGISWFAVSREIPLSRQELQNSGEIYARLRQEIVQFAAQRYAPGRSFCVRARRSYKEFPFTSIQLERKLGEAIIQETAWERVNLTQPDETFHVEVNPDGIHVYAEKERGPGGLPVGTAGRVLGLLSGGIDSPVAAFLMARRGCEVDWLHFTATPLQQMEPESYKVSRIAAELSRYTLQSRLFLVPYTYYDLALLGKPADYDLVLFRRFMARVAERLAGNIGAAALFSGDNLAQVASQTLPNIVSASRAVELPILRPLLTYEKQEIVDLAKQIGTYELSIEPYKDCCSIISRHPRTASSHEHLEELEREIFPKYEEMIEQTLAEAEYLEFEMGKLVRKERWQG